MRPGRQAGFTLLEIVTVLAILGMLVLVLAEGTGFGLRAWNTQNRLIESNADLDSLDRGLRQLVAGLDPLADGRTPPVEGAADRVAFAADLPSAAGVLSGRRVTVGLGVDAGGRLVLRWTPAPHAVRLRPIQANETELTHNVSHLDMAYFGPAQDGAAPSWNRTWSELTPPLLVRFRIVFKDGDPRHWPDIVVAPMQQPAPA
jgi:general secretion pathway protein J